MAFSTVYDKISAFRMFRLLLVFFFFNGMFFFPGQAQKKVLLEKFSSSWCGTCPAANLEIDTLLLKHPENLIVVVHHSGFWSDSMTIKESTLLAQEFTIGTPTGMVDRYPFGGNRVVSLAGSWESRVERQLDTLSYIQLDIQPEYDPSNRLLKVKVATQVATAPPPGDFRLHVYLTENGVTGSGIGYDQQNYYSSTHTGTGGPNHPLYALPHPIPNYVHNHVMRVALTDFWGIQGAFADAPQPGDQWSRTFEYEVDPKFNPSNMEVVAFVSYHNGPDRLQRSVVNANAEEVWDGISVPVSSDAYHLQTDPILQTVALQAAITSDRSLEASWYSVDGKLLSSQALRLPAGNTTTQLTLPPTANGVYVLYLSDGFQEVRFRTALFSRY